MAIFGIGIDFARCGFGYEGGSLPNVKFGVFRIWWCRESIFVRLARLHATLADMAKDMGR